MLRRKAPPVRWRHLPGLAPYEETLERMRGHAADMAAGQAGEEVWLLEHPPLYTAGTSARPEDLLNPRLLPVFRSGRGGQYTYHGPGQRVVYLMLDLRQRGRDIRAYVTALEQWIIDALSDLGVRAFRAEDRVGVWVRAPGPGGGREAKIAAIGVRVSRWITQHGIAVNVDPDLSHYAGIVPCGIREHGVTSLKALGAPADMARLDDALARHFERLFGPLRRV
jgi:lipoyl(octanoyl) transferase